MAWARRCCRTWWRGRTRCGGEGVLAAAAVVVVVVVVVVVGPTTNVSGRLWLELRLSTVLRSLLRLRNLVVAVMICGSHCCLEWSVWDCKKGPKSEGFVGLKRRGRSEINVGKHEVEWMYDAFAFFTFTGAQCQQSKFWANGLDLKPFCFWVFFFCFLFLFFWLFNNNWVRRDLPQSLYILISNQ